MPTNNTVSRAKFEAVRETAFGAITASFTRIGTSFDSSFSVIYVQNFTDQIMDFSVSFAGTDVTFSLAPYGIISTDMVTNSVQISAGEAAWVKARGALPGSGFVQVSAITAV
jgi:hypothetical protein